MAEDLGVEAFVAHIVFADVVEYARHTLESKNEIDQVLSAAVNSEKQLGGVLTAIDNGDGFFLAFQGDPRCAGDAAIRLHERFKRDLAVQVRIGVHSGVAFVREDVRGGVNLTGPAVEQAQRTMSASGGEFPLVSQETWTFLREFEAWKSRLTRPHLARLKGRNLVVVWRIGEFDERISILAAGKGACEQVDRLNADLVSCEQPGSTEEIGLFAFASQFYSAAICQDGEVWRVFRKGHDEVCFSNVGAALEAIEEVVFSHGTTQSPQVWVEREADRQLRRAIENQVSFVLVRSARFTGKTTLLATGKKQAESIGHHAVFHDFRSDGAEVIADQSRCYEGIVNTLYRQMGLDLTVVEELWESELGLNSNLERCVEYVLESVDSPVFWAWDEAERLLHQDYADDLFGLLRSWHNRRAWEEGSVWSKLTIAFTYRVDARAVIRNQQQSPFNVGFDVLIQDFSLDELGEMNRLFGNPLVQGAEIERMMLVTGGHPMVAYSVFEAISKGSRFADIEDGNIPVGSGLQAHLDDLWRLVSGSAGLSDACRLALLNRVRESDHMLDLVDLGILGEKINGELGFRCGLYEIFFKAKFR